MEIAKFFETASLEKIIAIRIRATDQNCSAFCFIFIFGRFTRIPVFFGEGVARPAANKSVIIEFLVENVDEDYGRIKDLTSEIVQKPTTMPWGNRSMLFRDPDSNLINFLIPVSAEAIKKFA